MHQLDVWLYANLTGSLVFNDGKFSFTYATEWLDNPNAPSISYSLPLQTIPLKSPLPDHSLQACYPSGKCMSYLQSNIA